jgi:hypothetical protein
VTVRTVTGEFAVEPSEGESGLFGVIEVRRVNGSQIRVPPMVFGMACRAVVHRDFSMGPLFGGDAPRDLIVAHETPVAVDVEVGIVTVVAAVGIFKTLVGETEETGHVIDTEFLTDRGNRAKGQHESQKNGPESPQSISPDMKISLAVVGCRPGRRSILASWDSRRGC